MFILGRGLAGLVNHLFGTESTLLVIGGLCGFLLTKVGSRQEQCMLKKVAVKVLDNLLLLIDKLKNLSEERQ
jgi:hypothetical protein